MFTVRMEQHSRNRFDRLLDGWAKVGQQLGRHGQRLGGDALRRAFAQNFEREGPGWESLAERTQRERYFAGFGEAHPILVRTGTFRASITEKGHPLHVETMVQNGAESSLSLGSRDPRFSLLHFGGTNSEGLRVPGRPAMVLQPDQLEGIDRVLAFAAERALGLR